MARWLVKILKTLINTGESGIVYCMECRKYVGLTLTWDVLKLRSAPTSEPISPGLTLTWDVLKPARLIEPSERIKINFNMGCIETRNYSVLSAELLQINFNMGCIETKRTVEACITFQRLTLTWDVLKPRIIFPIYTTIRINFNMGCIET